MLSVHTLYKKGNGIQSHSLFLIERTMCLNAGHCKRGNLCKSIRIGHSNVSQYFAVDLNVGFFEAKNEFTVRQTIDTRSSIDSNNPEAAEITFFDASIAEGII